jgi:hypothetical protein
LLLITNYPNFSKELKPFNESFEYIFFNPWGFSRKSIEVQLENILKNYQIQHEELIFYLVKDLFFGRRSDIAFKHLKSIIPTANINRISEKDLELLLNNPSV